MSDNRTLSEWISDEEHRWRALLQPVSLVIETDFSEHDVREAQRKYGAMVAKAARPFSAARSRTMLRLLALKKPKA